MIDLSDIPSLKKGGERVAATTTAIVGAMVDAFLPATGTAFAQACGHLINARLQKAAEILISELKSGNLDVLSDEKNAAVIPMGYRFYEAARQGENVFILRKLAIIIKNGVSGSLKPDRFIKISRSLESLDEIDLIVLAKYVEMTINFRKEDQSQFNDVFREVERKIAVEHEIEVEKFFSICAMLSGRGLLIGLTNPGLGGGANSFMASELAIEIANLSTSYEQ
ncbi:MAG: hypothetical protein IOC55_07090 [Methylobacterium sp.]|nr:hypothetical protein [Methylobacterium sp.]